MKRIINLAVRSSICNLRCTYCYLNQLPVWFKNTQINYEYTPEEVKRAFSIERLGGSCLFNICSDGETLLADKIVLYLKAILEAGHYVEFVTNMTVTKVLNDIFAFDADLLKRIEFKCSFHYLQLKTKGLLSTFANNIMAAKKRGCSFSVELISDDNYIPYIDEIKAFSLENFGALPHLSIPRNDKRSHSLLSSLSFKDFCKTWSSFESPFFDFKLKVYRKRVTDYCFAGRASLYVDLATGYSQQCYRANGYSFNVFANPDQPIPFCSIGKCNVRYCYNGHALLTVGCVKRFNQDKYGDIRNRICSDGTSWITSDMLRFMNEKAFIDDSPSTMKKDKIIMSKVRLSHLKARILRKINR